MEDKLVSIIVVCYNGEKYVDRFFESILSQTYNKIEIVFVNDGSSDNTEMIVKSYEDKIKKTKLSKEVKEKITYELGRLKNMSATSAATKLILATRSPTTIAKPVFRKPAPIPLEHGATMVTASTSELALNVSLKNLNLIIGPRVKFSPNLPA